MSVLIERPREERHFMEWTKTQIPGKGWVLPKSSFRA